MPKGIPRDKSVNRKVLHRLKIARGHLDKVISMVEDGDYCIDVVHQSQAVQSALKKADQLMIRNHMSTCMIKGNSHTKDLVEEMMRVMEKV